MRGPRLSLCLLVLGLVSLAVGGCGKRAPRQETKPRPSAALPAAAPDAGDVIEDEPAGEDDVVAKLIQKLESPRASRRKAALNALAALPDRKRARQANKALQQALLDDVPDVRSLAGIALLKINGKDGSYFIRPLLKDRDPNVRAVVLNELAKLGPDFSDELVRGLDDESPEIQEIVLDHLSRQKFKRADVKAVGLFEKTGSPRVRAQVLKYLLDIGSKRGVSAVAATLDDLDDANALTLAVRYLGRYGLPTQARKLVFFLNDREIGVRREAARAMGRQNLKTVDAVSGLVQLLEDDEPEVREAAHRSLRKLTNQKFGFDPQEQDPKKVEPAVKKWREWLEKNRAKLSQE